jgi:hypothetical protein
MEETAMSDRFVTVNTYSLPYEAELARNMLQAEGIEAVIGGDLTGSLLPLGEIQLQVREADAARAAGILAEQAAQATLAEDWETRAESGAGVWTCSLCGEPVPQNATICMSCQTPRDAIRVGRPAEPGQILPADAGPSPAEAVQRRDQVVATPLPPPAPPPPESRQDERPSPPTAVGDDIARRAFYTSVFGFAGAGLILPVAWWFLWRLFRYDGELSPAGHRHLWWALLINSVGVPVWLLSYLWWYSLAS